VTTDKFFALIGFESLRDLPDLEALRDAGLMRADAPPDPEAEEAEAEDAGDLLTPSELSVDRVAGPFWRRKIVPRATVMSPPNMQNFKR
jgi:hypothetical protein